MEKTRLMKEGKFKDSEEWKDFLEEQRLTKEADTIFLSRLNDNLLAELDKQIFRSPNPVKLRIVR